MKPENRNKHSIILVLAFGLVACILYGVGAGLRGDIGILLNPLAAHAGLRYDDVSICIAVMQLVFGAAQPVFGLVASRRSNRFVLIAGALLLAVSMAGMTGAASFPALLFSLGILFGLGAGALAFGLVLTSAIHFVGRENAMMISGMLNAAAGMVGFILSPLLQTMLDAQGLLFTLFVMAGVAVALIPVVLFVTSRDPGKKEEPRKEASEEKEASEAEEIPKTTETPKTGKIKQADDGTGPGIFREAFADRTFRLLVAGFSTCGFHMVIIESHLFSQYVLYGLDEMGASWAFSIYGVATIAGALLSGYLSTRLRKGRLLGFYYGFRAVWVLIYLFVLPKTFITAILFSIGLGFTGDATVSPTSGLVSGRFSIGKVAALIGMLFFVHQIGAFLSAWLGGTLRELTGNYTMIWMIDVALCVFASVMSLRIREQKPVKM